MLKQPKYASLLICIVVGLWSPLKAQWNSRLSFHQQKDSIVTNYLLEVMVNASQSIGNAQIQIKALKDQVPVLDLSLNNYSFLKGFNNFTVNLTDSSLEFKDKYTQEYLNGTGYLPSGAYQFELFVFSSTKDSLLYGTNQTFNLTQKLSIRTLCDNFGTSHSVNDSSTIIYSIHPYLNYDNLTYQVHVAEVRNIQESHLPFAYLKHYKWLPNVSRDTISLWEDIGALRKNKNYVLVIEAYSGETLIARSNRIGFNTYKTTNKVLNLLRQIVNRGPLDLPSNLNNGLIDQPSKELYTLKPSCPIKGLPFDTSNKILQVKGSIKSENLYSNQQYINTNVPSVYSRVTVTPEVTFLGLPIKSSIYLTTENNSKYQLNAGSIELDLKSYRVQKAEAILKDYRNGQQAIEALEQYKKHLLDSLESLRRSQTLIQPKIQLPKQEDSTLRMDVNAPDSIVTRNPIKETHSTDSLEKYVERERRIASQKADSIKDKISKLENKLKEIVTLISKYQRIYKKLDNKIPTEEELEKQVASLGKNKLLNSISTLLDNFQIGQFYPNFTPLTLGGIATRGVGASISFNKIYLQSIIGRAASVIYSKTDNTDIFTNNIKGVRAGYGILNKSCLLLSWVNITPQNALSKDRLGGNVLSLETTYSPLKSISFIAEASQSFLKDNIALSSLGNSQNQNLAYRCKVKYSDALAKTSICADMQKIPIGYMAPGVPFLRKDIIRYTIRAKHHLWRNNVIANISYQYLGDNLSQIQSATSTYQTWNTQLVLRFRKMPEIILTYTPSTMVQQQQKQVTQIVEYQTKGIAANYFLRLHNFFSVTNVTYTHQKTSMPELKMQYATLTFSQQFNVQERMLLALSINKFNSQLGSEDISFNNITGEVGFNMRKKWWNSIGVVTYFNKKDGENRLNLYYRTNIQMNKLVVHLQVGNNFIRDNNLNDFREEQLLSGGLHYYF